MSLGCVLSSCVCTTGFWPAGGHSEHTGLCRVTLTVVPSGGTKEGEKKRVEGKIPLQHGGECEGGRGSGFVRENY